MDKKTYSKMFDTMLELAYQFGNVTYCMMYDGSIRVTAANEAGEELHLEADYREAKNVETV